MADRNGYIGRAPGDSSVVVARQVFSPTGIQTTFTFASGYTIGYLDIYLNGARLISGQDYTASNGSTVGLTTYADGGDVLEAVAYKAFNAASVNNAPGNFSVGGNLSVNGTSTLTGNTTVGSAITLTASTGIVSATAFYGDGSNLTGVISGVELSQNGSSVGSAITAINFSGATVSTPTAGLSTVTIAKQLTIGVRVGTAVTFSITGSSFDVSGRSGNVAINV